MGNQPNKENNSLVKLCQFNIEQDPFNHTNVKAIKKPQDILQNQQWTHIEVQLNKKNKQKITGQQIPDEKLILKRNKYDKRQQSDNEPEMRSKSTKKIKRISTLKKTSYSKPENKSQEQIFKERIENSFRYFKSLKTLSLFQSRYGLSFPILILNRNKEISSLRRQIISQKQSHSYFSTNLNSLDNQETLSQNTKLAQQRYKLFGLLQKIERNVTKMFQTGRHTNVLKEITQLDNLVGLNPTNQNINALQRFIDKLSQVNFEFLDMLYYQLSSNHSQLYLSQASYWQMKYRKPLPIVDVKQFMMGTKQDYIGKKQSQRLKQIGLDLYKQNKVCFYILATNNQSFLFDNDNNLVINGQEKTNPVKNSQNIMKNSRNTHLNTNNVKFPQFSKLNLPTNPTLFQILINRYNAFAQLLQIQQITVVVLANQSKIQLINQLSLKNYHKWAHINLILLKHSQIPCLLIDGSLVLQSVFPKQSNQNISKESTQNVRPQKQPVKVSAGTGDLWDMLKQEQNQEGLQYLRNNKFQYIQVIGAQNCLQQCFDCFMLGYIHTQCLSWGTKVVQPCHRLKHNYKQVNHRKSIQQRNSKQFTDEKQTINSSIVQNYASLRHPSRLSPSTFFHDTLIYQGKSDGLKTILNNQQLYEQKLKQLASQDKDFYTFTNHSIFKVDFVESKIKDALWQQSVTYTKKVILSQFDQKQIVFFQKDLTDIFKPLNKSSNFSSDANERGHLKQKSFQKQNDNQFMLFKYERDENYYPLYWRQNGGVFDIEGASRSLSQKCLGFLEMSIEKYMGNRYDEMYGNFLRCYIDPHVSLEGQDLEEIKLEIQKRVNEVLVSKDVVKAEFTDSNNAEPKLSSPMRISETQKRTQINFTSSTQIERQVLGVLSSIEQIWILKQAKEQDSSQYGVENTKVTKNQPQEITIYIN